MLYYLSEQLNYVQGIHLMQVYIEKLDHLFTTLCCKTKVTFVFIKIIIIVLLKLKGLISSDCMFNFNGARSDTHQDTRKLRRVKF